MSVTGAAPVPMSLPVPATPPALLDGPTVRIRSLRAEAQRRSRSAIVVDVVGRAGSVVTLAATLVVACAVGALADGVSPDGVEGPAVARTLDGH